MNKYLEDECKSKFVTRKNIRDLILQYETQCSHLGRLSKRTEDTWRLLMSKLDSFADDAKLGQLVRKMPHDCELRHGCADITAEWIVDEEHFGKSPEEALKLGLKNG